MKETTITIKYEIKGNSTSSTTSVSGEVNDVVLRELAEILVEHTVMFEKRSIVARMFNRIFN